MGINWTDDMIAEVVRLRDHGLSFPEIGKRLSVTHRAALGVYHRAKFPKPAPNRVPRERAKNQADRFYANLKPSKSPNAPDSSTPKFAHHAEHVRAVLLAGGFPRLILQVAA